MRGSKLDRRSLLRGAAGAAVALPFLEAMLPRKAYAQAAPKRYVVCFAGMSLGRDNAGKLTDIIPDVAGANFDLKPPLAPLEAVKNDVTVVSGLRIPIGGAGGRLPGFHKSSLSPLLSGVLPPSTSPDCHGPTSDQIVARDPAFAGQTRFPSLAYRVQAEYYRGGGNVGVISWAGKGQKNDPIVSPALAFENVFGGFTPPHGGVDAATKARLLQQKEDSSVLDLVRGNGERLRKRLGRPDQIRLERHFDEIRALETRLKAMAASTSGMTRGCSAPPKPGADPAAALSPAEGSGVIGYAGEEERAGVLTGILLQAFACDLARVATLQYTCAQSFMNVEALTGIKMDLHELAHLSVIQGGKDVAQQTVMKMYGWHMKHFAALVSGLRSELGPDGRPVLDNTVLVFVNEGGLGPAEGKNPASHSTDDMMVVVAGGRALGLRPGRHIATAGEHPAKALVAAMNAVGVASPSLGEVTGRLDL